jgi:glycosyltransferase involved in cell wall biosynthesis
MVSVIILTKNEEQDLPGCLASLTGFDDIHVLDSGSDDRTVAIAEAAGACVTTNSFKSFGHQRNWALDHVSYRHDWILFLDADERSTPSFEQSLKATVEAAADELAGLYCCCKMLLEDRWLKRCDNFPKWQMRVCRKGRARFTDFGHGQKEGEVDGQLEYLKEPYIHHGFSKGWTHWLERHNRYASCEAKARLEKTASFRDMVSPHGSIRNPAIKILVSKLPGWPFFRFVYSYLLRGGFFEGTPGFIYCVNIAYFEFLIKIKMRELRRRKAEGDRR